MLELVSMLLFIPFPRNANERAKSGADQPFCATYRRYLSTGAANPLTSLFCTTAATTITALVHANQSPLVASTGSSAGTSLVSSSTSEYYFHGQLIK